MLVIKTKSKKSLYLQSEIKGYKHPQGVMTGGSILWHNQNIEMLSKKYDLCIIDPKSGVTTYYVKQ